MNCPSRTDEIPRSDGLNQSPNPLSNDLTTNEDLKGRANDRQLRRGASSLLLMRSTAEMDDLGAVAQAGGVDGGPQGATGSPGTAPLPTTTAPGPASPRSGSGEPARSAAGADDGLPGQGGEGKTWLGKTTHVLKTFFRFIGPGFIVSVAYIDPGNYSTDIAAGARYRFQLLFVVLLSNLFAIFLQSLSIKLGSVTGRNLAEACRAFLPRYANYFLYVLAEAAIIATDIAEVIGTAIALNLLQPRIPLVAGCAISIVDVLAVLVFCRPRSDTARGLRAFELLVAPLVLAVVVCFCIQLSLVHADAPAARVLRGYLPSRALVEPQGLYQACGILGATVMPHSIYLGSGIVQPRLRAYDARHGLLPTASTAPSARLSIDTDDDDKQLFTYVPSLAAIRHSLKYAVAELALSLFTFALFVNSAILIVAGAALYQNPDALGADIFAIHALLSASLSPAAGTIFALALLFSGLSAGVVCTIAGQMVSEGALQWTVAPWLRRLLTRSISILPSIAIAGAVGRDGLDAALNGTQVALSIVLPFITAPLIWFTCCNKYMTVQPGGARFLRRERYTKGGTTTTTATAEEDGRDAPVCMANSWPVALLGLVIWLIMAAMNVANLVLLKKA